MTIVSSFNPVAVSIHRDDIRDRRTDSGIIRGYCRLQDKTKGQKKRWGSRSGSDRPPIGLSLSSRQRTAPSPEPKVNCHYCSPQRPSSPLLSFFCFPSRRVSPCIECQTETNARLSQRYQLQYPAWKEYARRHIHTYTSAHTLKLRHPPPPPLRDSLHCLMGYSIKRPLLKGTEEERVWQRKRSIQIELGGLMNHSCWIFWYSWVSFFFFLHFTVYCLLAKEKND